MGDTRAQILEAATDLFIEQGYDKTSLREIAQQVDVTKAAVYYHFPSKVEILEALVAPAFDTLTALLDQWDRAHGDLGRWGRSLAYLIDWMLDQQRLFILIDRNIETIEALGQASDHFAAHRDLHHRIDELLADERTPVGHRIRMVSAMGAVSAMFTFGGRPPADASLEEVRAVLVDIVGAVLGTEAPAP